MNATRLAAAPPFPVGTRVRFAAGADHRRGGDDAPWIRVGDIGVVVSVTEGQDGHPELGRAFAEPLDGWSTVEFHGHPEAHEAIGVESIAPAAPHGWRFEAVR